MLSAERGSVLILMPAAVLIVVVLAALTVDLSLVHLGRREALAAAEAASNDAVTAGLDEQQYRAGRGYSLHATRVRQSVIDTLHARGLDGELTAPPHIEIAATTVTVRLELRVDYVFSRSLPGAPDHTTVSASGSATPVVG